METKNLDIILDLLNKLKKVDGDIKQIEVFANQAANEQCTVKLNLEIASNTTTENEQKPVIDSKSSITRDERQVLDYYRQSFMHAMGIGFNQNNSEELKTTSSFKQKISEIETLKVLGVLLEVKLALRETIIKELDALNIK